MIDQDWKFGAKYRFKMGLLSEHLTFMVSGPLCMHALVLMEAFSEEYQRRSSLIKTISLYLFIFILSVISGLKGWLTGSPEPM